MGVTTRLGFRFSAGLSYLRLIRLNVVGGASESLTREEAAELVSVTAKHPNACGVNIQLMTARPRGIGIPALSSYGAEARPPPSKAAICVNRRRTRSSDWLSTW